MSSYSQKRPSDRKPFIWIASLVLILVILLSYYQCSNQKKEIVNPPEVSAPHKKLRILEATNPEVISPQETLRSLSFSLETSDPEELMKNLVLGLAKQDQDVIQSLKKSGSVTEAKLNLLTQLASEGKLSMVNLREVGELKLRRQARWAIDLEEGEKFYFEFNRKENNQWKLEQVIHSNKTGDTPKDVLEIADRFLQATLRQDFALAQSLSEGISDAKIAGLCILFEEGQYQLRKKNPLRPMFLREKEAGFITKVVSKNSEDRAELGVLLRREKEWKVNEVNLDSLLADYTKRHAGGDAYYSPLIKNPAGGDTIVIFFEFDESTLSLRQQHQLKIVAALLKVDQKKKIVISGHTDSLGTNDYNTGLSSNRARQVAQYLLGQGVPKAQIVTEGKGETQPRRPNQTQEGSDNPDGRKVNRRTEIYLDF